LGISIFPYGRRRRDRGRKTEAEGQRQKDTNGIRNSVSNNIAEGWKRGTYEELLTFLYYARGSCAEVRSMVRVLQRLNVEQASHAIEAILELALCTSRQLGGWLESLKNSDHVNPRDRNDQTRRAAELGRRRAEFLLTLRRVQDDAKPHGNAPPIASAPEV
jgi:hypothetical protein